MTWSFNNTKLILNPMNEPTVTSVQELRARYEASFPEHAKQDAQRREEAVKSLQDTFQKFTTQLLKARAKKPEVLKKPPGR